MTEKHPTGPIRAGLANPVVGTLAKKVAGSLGEEAEAVVNGVETGVETTRSQAMRALVKSPLPRARERQAASDWTSALL